MNTAQPSFRPDVPPPYASRPLVLDDAQAATDVTAACEQEEIGEVYIEIEDVTADWARPSFDIATESVGVLDGERLIAVGQVSKARHADVHVLPEHRGRGIGTALMRWTWDVARAGGGQLVGQSVPETSAAVALFEANGYQPRWTSWTLELPAGAEIVSPSLPAGVRIREYVEGRDGRAAYQVIEDAFNEWPDRQPTTYDDWAPGAVGRGGFEPWNLLLAVERARDGAETVVGACHVVLAGDEGYVNSLAVRRDRRGRGLARALLAEAFTAARARGATRSTLSTDSRTGALGVYERVGMRVDKSFVHWALDLGPRRVSV